jgi:hypothetical protein
MMLCRQLEVKKMFENIGNFPIAPMLPTYAIHIMARSVQ